MTSTRLRAMILADPERSQIGHHDVATIRDPDDILVELLDIGSPS